MPDAVCFASGRAASEGPLALEPPRPTRSQPEFHGFALKNTIFAKISTDSPKNTCFAKISREREREKVFSIVETSQSVKTERERRRP